jgi:hypothetical protein
LWFIPDVGPPSSARQLTLCKIPDAPRFGRQIAISQEVARTIRRKESTDSKIKDRPVGALRWSLARA